MAAGAPVYGEGNWKPDEEYREGLRDFSESHDAEELAVEAPEELDADFDDSDDEDIDDSGVGSSEDEPEW